MRSILRRYSVLQTVKVKTGDNEPSLTVSKCPWLAALEILARISPPTSADGTHNYSIALWSDIPVQDAGYHSFNKALSFNLAQIDVRVVKDED